MDLPDTVDSDADQTCLPTGEVHVASTAEPFRVGEDFELAHKLQDEEYNEHFEHNRQLHADSSLAISLQNREQAKRQKERKHAKHTEKADARLAAFYQERAEREREEELKQQEQQARIEQARILHAEYRKRQKESGGRCESDEATARQLQDEELAKMLQKREVRKYRQQQRRQVAVRSPPPCTRNTDDSGYLEPVNLPPDLRRPPNRTLFTSDRDDRIATDRGRRDRDGASHRPQNHRPPFSGVDTAPRERAPPLPPRPFNSYRK